MAFKLSPTHKKKDPFAKFQKMGWINSPVKQALTQEEKDNVDKTAEKEAKKDLARDKGTLVDEFYDEVTGDKVKVFEATGEGDSDTNRSWEEGYKIAQDKYGTEETFDEWKARAIKEKRWEERTKQPDSKPGKQDYDVVNLATFIQGKNLFKPGELKVSVQNEAGTGFEKRMMNDKEMEDFLKRGGHGELIQEWRTASHVGKDADQSVYDDVNQGTNVEKGQVKKSEEQEPDKENASGKTVFDSPTPQHSPVRQLMNKYMPSKSIAKQKEVTLPEFEIEFDPSSSDYKYNKETGEETLMTPEEKLHARKENLKTGTGRTTTSYTDPKTGEKIQVGGDKITAMFQRKK